MDGKNEITMEKDTNRWIEILEINADSNTITIKELKIILDPYWIV